tara:strand:+ start:3883 stop:4188 length:306 start_codon:yes stop_codon:yes gene_type:complete
MARYTSMRKKRDKKTSNMVLATVIYPEIPLRNNDVYITSKEGDRLDLLAYRYYQTPSLWWIIAHANKLGKKGMSINPGLQIRIPTAVEKILDDYKTLNNNL